ncbi:hypothetical protein DSUL_50130 [Desulfovibrionales bacterium]
MRCADSFIWFYRIFFDEFLTTMEYGSVEGCLPYFYFFAVWL